MRPYSAPHSVVLAAVVLLVSTVVHSLRLVTYVAPDGSDYPCGGVDQQPCNLGSAIRNAVAHTTIVLGRGIYTGSYRITMPLTIVGESFTDGGSPAGRVVMDGRGLRRPLTYDNVPAHLDGITFLGGVGEGGGCVLVSLLTNRVDEVNNITRCTFINCTGLATETATPISAGAIAVVYGYSHGSSYEMNRVVMTNNYGRSKTTSAGGALVLYGPPTGAKPHNPCNTFVVQVPLEAGPATQSIAGVYQRVPETLHGGHPVYRSTRFGNPAKTGPPQLHVIAFCSEKNIYSLFEAPLGKSIADILKLNLECSNPLFHTHNRPISSVVDVAGGLSAMKWVNTATALVELLRMSCQDMAKSCHIVEVVNAKDAQSHRNGVFYRTNITRGGRPSFRKVHDGEKLQWLWYCPGPKEWIVSDDDPELATDTQKVCSRGITTLDTLAVHPMYATQWRYWDLDTWRSSPTVPHGISIRCRPPVRDMCNAVEVVNNALDGSSGPFIITNFTWNAKPTYKLAGGNKFMWHCGIFSEWVISDTNPRTLNPDEETCSRSVSSHPNHAFMPTLSTTKWAMFTNEEWKAVKAPMAVRCIDECPRLSVSSVPREFVGIYNTIAVHNGTRVYHKANPSAYIFIEDERWVVASDMRNVEETTVLTAAVPKGSQRGNIFLATTWSAVGSSVDENAAPAPHFSCDIHKYCSRLEIPTVPGSRFPQVAGLWLQLPGTVGQRPAYKHSSHSFFIFYCFPFSKWVLGPDPPPSEERGWKCPSWFSTRSTASTHPAKDTTWILVTDGQKWETLPTAMKVQCAGDPDEPDSIVVPQSVYHSASAAKRSASTVTDSITDCNFTGNIALSQTTAAAAGAVAFHYGRAGISVDPVGAFRRVHAMNNEAVAGMDNRTSFHVQGAGAIMIQNQYEHRLAYATIVDSIIAENWGDTGAVGLDGVRATVTRVQLVRNYADSSGGCIHARHRSNVTIQYSQAKSNFAQRTGGAVIVSQSSSLYISRSDFHNNTSNDMEGTSVLGGYVSIQDSKFIGVQYAAIAGCFITMVGSTMECLGSQPINYNHAFGCLPPGEGQMPPPRDGGGGVGDDRGGAGGFAAGLRGDQGGSSLSYYVVLGCLGLVMIFLCGEPKKKKQ